MRWTDTTTGRPLPVATLPPSGVKQITWETLADLLRAGSLLTGPDGHTYRCDAGVPAGARVIGVTVDAEGRMLYVEWKTP